jgi:carboxymethylenebutenolidase
MPGDIRPTSTMSPDLKSQLVSLVPDMPLSRRGFVVTSLSAGFAAAAMPVCAQTVITTDAKGLVAGEVKIPVPDGSIPGYRARPADNKKHAVVLVVHEAFGVHEHIKDICRRFAKAGYYAIAPELYTRQGDVSKVTDIQQILQNFIAKTPDKEVMADLDATAAVAAKSGHADMGKLAITGFCWGGRIVWLYAAHNPKLKAGVAWYGPMGRPSTALQPKDPIDLAAEIKAPVLGLYGGADQGIPSSTVEKMQAALQAAKKPSEIIVYPDTPHAFNADYRPSYRKQQAEDGWAKALAWFKKNGVA